MTSQPLRLQQLEASLAALAGSDADGPMTLSELDGFIAGLLLCPDLILPSVWLPIVLGSNGEAGGLSGSGAAVQDCVQQVLAHYNAVSRDLQRANGRYVPVFDFDSRHDDVLWELWMGGFEHAMAISPQSWMAVAQDDGDEPAALAMAGVMALIAITEQGPDMDPDKIAALTNAAPHLIPGWVETLNAWRLRNAAGRSEPEPTRASKVGRNAPCTCGSGKKYKKCCGLN